VVPKVQRIAETPVDRLRGQQGRGLVSAAFDPSQLLLAMMSLTAKTASGRFDSSRPAMCLPAAKPPS
jgi:hypothetical protein